MGLVRFVTTTGAGYSGITSKDKDTLYFISDERRIYKGEVPYSGGIFTTVAEFPETGEVNTLYVNSATGEVRYYNGISYQTVVPATGKSITGNGDGSLATTAAVAAYVTSQTSSIQTQLNGFDGRISANATAIDAEKTRAEGAELANAKAISAETTRATEAEQENTKLIKASAISLAAQAANTNVMSSIYGEIRQNANRSQQGACMYQIDNQTFLFCAMKPGTGATDTNTYGYIYNVNTNTLVTSSSIQNAGHANCACYNQNEACIILSGCDTGIGNYNIIKLNPRTLAVISTTTPSTNFIGMAYDNVNKVYYAFNQSYIYVLDINFNITSSFAFDSSTMTTQGCYYYDNIFYLPDSNTQSIYMFDVTNKMALINIATLTDWPNTTYIEIEQITGIGNDMYIVSQIYNDAITCIFNILVNPNNTFTNYTPSSNVYADYSIAASFGTNTSNNPSCSIYPFVFFNKYDHFYFNGTIEHPISLTKKQYVFNNGTFTNTLLMNNGSITFNNCTFTGANVSTGQVITGIYADYIFNDVTIQHDNAIGMFVQTGNIRFNSITFVNKSSVNHIDAAFEKNVQIYVGSITQTYPYSITNQGQAITSTKRLSIETLESNTYTIPLINAYRNLEFIINTTNETINANFGVQINAIWLGATKTEFRGSGVAYTNGKTVGINVYGTLNGTTLTIYITVINITDNTTLSSSEVTLSKVIGIS